MGNQLKRQISNGLGFQLPYTLGKTGMVIPLPLTSHGYREAVSTEKLRHNFGIRALETRGIPRPRPYPYICVRCRYSFVVNQTSGLIVAVDRSGKPLPEPENSKRTATFAEGPCPGLHRLIRRSYRTRPVRRPGKFLQRLASAAALLLAAPRHTSGTYRKREIHAAVAITPADLLS